MGLCPCLCPQRGGCPAVCTCKGPGASPRAARRRRPSVLQTPGRRPGPLIRASGWGCRAGAGPDLADRTLCVGTHPSLPRLLVPPLPTPPASQRRPFLEASSGRPPPAVQPPEVWVSTGWRPSCVCTHLVEQALSWGCMRHPLPRRWTVGKHSYLCSSVRDESFQRKGPGWTPGTP